VGSSAMMTLGLLRSARAPALHPGRELIDLAVPLGLELDEFQELGDPLAGLALGDVEEAGEDDQVLIDREVEVEGDFLGNDAGLFLQGAIVDVRRQAVHGQRP
jgi:hypothetical protein